MDLPPFQALLDSYSHDVHRFLVTNVGPVDADDCYQETWIAALRSYPRLQHATNLRGWLLTIAARKAIDVHRLRGRGPVTMADPTELAGPAESGLVGESLAGGRLAGGGLAGRGSVSGGLAGGALASDDTADGLWDAVAGLPPKQRAAVVL